MLTQIMSRALQVLTVSDKSWENHVIKFALDSAGLES